MLIDDVKIKVTAGRGGKGAVAFNKVKMSLGPVGGSGGDGGSVYAEGVSDLSALNQFQHKREFEAENGLYGRDQFRDGHNGKDLILKVPVGTVIHPVRNLARADARPGGALGRAISNGVHNLTTGEDKEITQIGERVLLAKGGHGGKGNFLFRSPKNTSPKQSQPGLPGETFNIRLELKFIADVGFIGLPNVGKSSLLNELTNATSKVANYPFTTLEPNLGVYYELILADIPGLIEGSSSGKGLGIKFLRHIERTGALFHFVSAESPTPSENYKTIRKELGAYNKKLLEKPEYLFLSKSDTVSLKETNEKLAALKKLNPKIVAISIYDDKTIEKARRILNAIKAKKIRGQKVAKTNLIS